MSKDFPLIRDWLPGLKTPDAKGEWVQKKDLEAELAKGIVLNGYQEDDSGMKGAWCATSMQGPGDTHHMFAIGIRPLKQDTAEEKLIRKLAEMPGRPCQEWSELIDEAREILKREEKGMTMVYYDQLLDRLMLSEDGKIFYNAEGVQIYGSLHMIILDWL